MDTSKLNELFKNILDEHDKKYEDISKNYKKHLKNVIHEKMSYIVFVSPKQKNKAELLISSSKTSESVSDMTDEASTEFEIKLMWDVAKIIRKVILTLPVPIPDEGKKLS